MTTRFVLIFLTFTSAVIAGDVILGSTDNPQAKEHKLFKIDSSKLDKIPKWDKTSVEVPFPISDAIRLAKAKAKADFPKEYSHIQSVTFTPRRLKDGREVWAYSVSFRILDVLYYRAETYLVLLDGSVITPVAAQRAEQGAAANP